MTTPTILPVLDDCAREYACSHIEPLQDYINDYADGMVNDGLDIGDAVSNAHGRFCDFMLGNGFEPDNDQADGVAPLIEACMLEVRRACAGRKRPKTFLHTEAYFKGADLLPDVRPHPAILAHLHGDAAPVPPGRDGREPRH